MGRLGQVFTAPGPEEEDLPIPPSAWHSGREVRIPMEHWEVILDFAEKLDAEKTRILRHYAYPSGGWILPPADELNKMTSFIANLQEELLKAPSLVPEASSLFPENFSNKEHVRMLHAVIAVLMEANKLGLPFEGNVDT